MLRCSALRHSAFRDSVCAAALAAAFLAAPARAQDVTPADGDSEASSIVVTAKATRSATAIPQSEIQKILPGVSPLKAIQTLPGVLYITADPWGNNEQNAQIFIHGFAFNQLGYTMDGIPLGDQSYGNYNGLSPQRAVTSENVGRVVVTTGAGDLGTPSNSNLGGTVETFSSDPRAKLGVDQPRGLLALRP
jgi:outer membrane receptor protein involved in Fe transport